MTTAELSRRLLEEVCNPTNYSQYVGIDNRGCLCRELAASEANAG